MDFYEKIDIISNLLKTLELVPEDKRHQLAGIIIGYSMACDVKEV